MSDHSIQNTNQNLTEYSDFTKVDIRIGTILEVNDNAKARKPAYILKIDFGEELGTKTSSAQITEYYSKEDLIGKQIMAVTNFAAKRVAGVKSEVLVLGCVHQDIDVVLLHPSQNVPNGAKVA